MNEHSWLSLFWFKLEHSVVALCHNCLVIIYYILSVWENNDQIFNWQLLIYIIRGHSKKITHRFLPHNVQIMQTTHLDYIHCKNKKERKKKS